MSPAEKLRPSGVLSKGKLLTTPSRLLKLIIPLKALDDGSDKDIEPLALLVHPQQPLSYLERLIQSELPPVDSKDGSSRIPKIYFKAEDSQTDEATPKLREEKIDTSAEDLFVQPAEESHLEEEIFEGQTRKTGKVAGGKTKGVSMQVEKHGARSNSADTPDDSTTLGSHRRPSSTRFVRWSSSTDIGDFIRDAARGKEFSIEIEGASEDIFISVPSFNDRTHFLRLRLRKTAGKIIDMAVIKRECDTAAHKGAQRVALAGAGLLVSYWYTVYRLTFETDLGWDVMEPVTYLVGLSTLIAGYLWFLYHNREVSYRSALNLTISRRQTKLYEAKGFNIQHWEALIEEANVYRKEIKQIADEYDVDWDEREDEKDDSVTDAMRKSRTQNDSRNDKKSKNEKEDDDREED